MDISYVTYLNRNMEKKRKRSNQDSELEEPIQTIYFASKNLLKKDHLQIKVLTSCSSTFKKRITLYSSRNFGKYYKKPKSTHSD